MQAISQRTDSERYARAIRASKRVRWDIDEDVSVLPTGTLDFSF